MRCALGVFMGGELLTSDCGVVGQIHHPRFAYHFQCALLWRLAHSVYLLENGLPSVVNFVFPWGIFDAMGVSLHGFEMFPDSFYLQFDDTQAHSVCRG